MQQGHDTTAGRPQAQAGRIRVIACGAIAREIIAVLAANRMDHVSLACLPAILHNHPERIAPEVEREILTAWGRSHGA